MYAGRLRRKAVAEKSLLSGSDLTFAAPLAALDRKGSCCTRCVPEHSLLASLTPQRRARNGNGRALNNVAAMLADQSFEVEEGRGCILPSVSKEAKTLRIAQLTTPAFRVLIVDRDSMSSDLLAGALMRNRRYDAAAIQSGELLQALATSEIDLVVIGAEIDSMQGSGFDLAHKVSRAYPDTSIVILLNSASHDAVMSAFRAGARGVFSRQQPMSEFLDCVEHVSKGFIWAGREESNALLQAFRSIAVPHLVMKEDSPALTARELQVVQLAAKGKTNRSIANELCLSEHTVKNYLFRAFEKVGVSSRVELLFYLTIRGHSFNTAGCTSDDLDLLNE